jgi:hypothetical protein
MSYTFLFNWRSIRIGTTIECRLKCWYKISLRVFSSLGEFGDFTEKLLNVLFQLCLQLTVQLIKPTKISCKFLWVITSAHLNLRKLLRLVSSHIYCHCEFIETLSYLLLLTIYLLEFFVNWCVRELRPRFWNSYTWHQITVELSWPLFTFLVIHRCCHDSGVALRYSLTFLCRLLLNWDWCSRKICSCSFHGLYELIGSDELL